MANGPSDAAAWPPAWPFLLVAGSLVATELVGRAFATQPELADFRRALIAIPLIVAIVTSLRLPRGWALASAAPVAAYCVHFFMRFGSAPSARDRMVLGLTLGLLVLATAFLVADLQHRARLRDRSRVEQLEAMNRAFAESNRDLEAFGHTVAHDLRAPLRATRHLVDEVLEDDRSRLSPESVEHLRAVQTTTARMGHLIDDLLQLSIGGKRELARAEVDVSAQAREVAREIEQRHPGRDGRFEVEPGLRATADPDLLRIVLTNLLRNASKFAKDRRPARIRVGARQTPQGRAFFVEDDGIGFEPAKASELFRTFSRLHGNAFEGTGIGLATVKRIVERHGGKAWAEGRPGEGATFYFTLAD